MDVNQQPEKSIQISQAPPTDGSGSGTVHNIEALVSVLGTFNIAIPIVFGAYRVIRDLVKQHGIDVPVLSDPQLIQLMQEPADRIVQRANEYIAAHKPPST